MSPPTPPIQVITLGASPVVGSLMAANLLPKVFATHFFTPSDQPEKLIPIILSKDSPISAVVLGAAVNEEYREQLRKAVKEGGGKEVAWLAAANPVQVIGGGAPPTLEMMQGYAKVGAEKMVAVLEKLRDEGKLGQDGVHLW